MGVRRIIAVLFVIVGIIWILQGIDILGGSGMSGHPIWAVFGVILVIAAAALARPRSRT